MAASLLTFTQSRNPGEENREIMHALARHNRLRTALSLVVMVLFLCASVFYDVLHLGQIQFVIALLTLVAIIVFLGSSVPYWHRVLVFARVRG